MRLDTRNVRVVLKVSKALGFGGTSCPGLFRYIGRRGCAEVALGSFEPVPTITLQSVP